MTVYEGKMIIFSHEMLFSRRTGVFFTLKSITGNADLFVKLCKIPLNQYGQEIGECVLTKENRLERDVHKSVLATGVDKVVRVFGTPEDFSQQYHYRYLAGVLGVAEQSQFSLTAIDLNLNQNNK